MPTEIGNLTSLAFLSFDFNDVSGELPTTFEQLSNLTSLSFRHNNLQGSLPTWLDKLDGLKELGLSSNNFQGQVTDKNNQPPSALDRVLRRFSFLCSFHKSLKV
jgi:hypothetical protein